MNDTSTLAPVVKSVVVLCDPVRAFELFTVELGDWWPLETHSVGGAAREAVVVEQRVGGQVFELLRGGGRGVWGDVVAWDPPARFAMTWHPGSDPAQATEVDVRFTPVAAGTLVELEHRGWERRADGAAVRPAYDSGWDLVLARYQAAS